MASYEETLTILEEMRSRFESGFSSSDRLKIEQLYFDICGKRVRKSGCKDCYRDAYIETRVKLKRLGTMPKKPNYILKAGAIIHPQGTSDFYSLGNIPDEIAEKWLGEYPADINKFETYPADWESRVKARKEGTAVEPTTDELKAEIARLTAVNEAKDAEIEALKQNAGCDDGAAAMEIETLKADLEAAKQDIDALTAEKIVLEAEVSQLKAPQKTTRKKAAEKAPSEETIAEGSAESTVE